MDELDKIAIKEAESALKKGFSWQAYLVLCAAEERERRRDMVPGSEVDESIDSFGERYCEYSAVRGTDGGYLALKACLDVGVATFSELLATTSGEERECVKEACARIGNMQ